MKDFNFMSVKPTGGSYRNKRNLITLSEFFESEDNNGYVKPETFKTLIKKLETAPGFKRQYSIFFDCVNEGHLIHGVVEKRTHLENQQDYIFLNMKRGRMTVESTVYLFDNMEKFIKDYADGRISIAFTWDDLVEFCNNH